MNFYISDKKYLSDVIVNISTVMFDLENMGLDTIFMML